MATLAKGYSFGATESVTNAKLHALVDSATITGIVNADIAAEAAIDFSKIAQTDIDGSKLIGLANIVSGAGVIPAANLTSVAQKGANGDITSLTACTQITGMTTPLTVAQGGTGTTTGWSFGAWVDKSASYGSQQATTDGFVCARATRTGAAGTLDGYTDANAIPATLRVFASNDVDETYCSIMFPVKKGDYWRVVVTGLTMNSVYWIPLGT